MTTSRCRRLPHIFLRNPSKGNNSQCVQRHNRRAAPTDGGAKQTAPPAAMQALSIIVNKVWEKRDEIKRCACEVNIGLRALISGNDLHGVRDGLDISCPPSVQHPSGNIVIPKERLVP